MKKYNILEAIETRATGRNVRLDVPLSVADWSTEYQNASAPRKLEYIHRCQFGCKTVVPDSREGGRDPVAESIRGATIMMAEVIFGDVRRDLLDLLRDAYERGQYDLAERISTMVQKMEGRP